MDAPGSRFCPRVISHYLSLCLFALCTVLSSPVWAVDHDGDGIDDAVDNCPSVSNANQQDTDGDGVGDACDAFPNNPEATTDTDHDGKPDSINQARLPIIFSDSFESGSLTAGGWSSTGTWNFVFGSAASGNYFARIPVTYSLSSSAEIHRSVSLSAPGYVSFYILNGNANGFGFLDNGVREALINPQIM